MPGRKRHPLGEGFESCTLLRPLALERARQFSLRFYMNTKLVTHDEIEAIYNFKMDPRVPERFLANPSMAKGISVSRLKANKLQRQQRCPSVDANCIPSCAIENLMLSIIQANQFDNQKPSTGPNTNSSTSTNTTLPQLSAQQQYAISNFLVNNAPHLHHNQDFATGATATPGNRTNSNSNITSAIQSPYVEQLKQTLADHGQQCQINRTSSHQSEFQRDLERDIFVSTNLATYLSSRNIDVDMAKDVVACTLNLIDMSRTMY